MLEIIFFSKRKKLFIQSLVNQKIQLTKRFIPCSQLYTLMEGSSEADDLTQWIIKNSAHCLQALPPHIPPFSGHFTTTLGP